MHWANKITMQPSKLIQHTVVIDQRNIVWALEAFRRRVRRATTANLGRANDRIPGRKPTMVQRMAPDFCSTERMSKCFPLPEETAAHEKATESQVHI